MLNKRAIPILLIDSRKLVKSVNFNKLSYVGDPINAVKIFNEKFVDELIVIDITRKKNITSPDFELIEDIANECFIPLTYGGNIKTLKHAEKLFKIGIEKISVNSMLIENPKLVRELVENFGASSIVGSIDFSYDFFGRIIVQNNKTKIKVRDFYSWLSFVEDLGIGELLINSVNEDGSMNGMDYEVAKKILSNSKVPVIYAGGVGSFDHIKKGFECGMPAIGVGMILASIFAATIFYGKFKAVLISYLNQKQIKELNEN